MFVVVVYVTMFDFDWIWYRLLCETAQMAGKLKPESMKIHAFGDTSMDGRIACLQKRRCPR